MTSLFHRLFSRTDPKLTVQPLYAAVVAQGRQPHWYIDGAVPDTVDGRFDMVVAIMTLALLRLEQEGAAQEAVWLTELFIDDMTGQLRQEGIGDVVVGKHVGRMVSALGGRLSAYRAALAGGEELRAALSRNLYRGDPPTTAALDHVEAGVRDRWIRIGRIGRDRLIAGDLG
ncbi:MAG: ubiquinol-cytochrome C chaperone family protein [Sphingobium sp.]